MGEKRWALRVLPDPGVLQGPRSSEMCWTLRWYWVGMHRLASLQTDTVPRIENIVFTRTSGRSHGRLDQGVADSESVSIC